MMSYYGSTTSRAYSTHIVLEYWSSSWQELHYVSTTRVVSRTTVVQGTVEVW
jgi:hypothetical protein